MLRPGNVYVWEEKGPSGGENGYQVCIERWTEGLSWSASRIRECVYLFSFPPLPFPFPRSPLKLSIYRMLTKTPPLSLSSMPGGASRFKRAPCAHYAIEPTCFLAFKFLLPPPLRSLLPPQQLAPTTPNNRYFARIHLAPRILLAFGLRLLTDLPHHGLRYAYMHLSTEITLHFYLCFLLACPNDEYL